MTALTQAWRDFTPTRGLLFPFLAPDADVAAHLMAEALGPVEYEISVRQPNVHGALLGAGARPIQQQVEFVGAL